MSKFLIDEVDSFKQFASERCLVDDRDKVEGFEGTRQE